MVGFVDEEDAMNDFEAPQQDRFTHEDAWRVGSWLVEKCLGESLGVTISIVLGTQRVFHAALPGTSADNDDWVARKIEVVRRFDQPSHAVYERYAKSDPDFLAHFGLSAVTHAPTGGAVPIRVRGSLVGVLAVSGLASEQDHDLAVEALSQTAGS
jgi:uncharacterized protein (UPF0303 family)